ncbi:restriction endonuclease subunit S [Thiolapillus sp.]|uniref:restriction endonuclease subunit S n=5 Tax=Thiolapillus sp. TaxID=2017437 RepID=UPI003AF45ADF
MRSKSDKKKPLVPSLRFPEFREAGAWEVKRLGEIGKISKGKGISKSDIKPNGALPCIRYGELYTHYGEVIRDVVSFTDANPDNLVLSEENDVIIPASGETKEDIATASCVSVKGVALGGDLNIFYSPMNGMFLAYYIRGNLKFEISKVAQGNSVVHLYTTQLEKLKLAVPPYPKEQQKIAHCLSSLDEVIGLQAKKVQALKQHKKGLMQQLFPAEGETTPRLRFPEFREAGAWEVKRLGEIVDITGGGTPSRKNQDFWEGDIPWVSSSDISEDFVKEISITRFITPGAIQKSATKLIPKNSILLVSRVGVGKLAITRKPICTSQDFTNLTPHKYNELFLAYYLKSISHVFESFNQGMAIKGFTKEDVESLTLALPDVKSEEQQKIAHCLSSLDEVIGLESHKLDALKNLKKGLMQQLFPQEVA